MNMLVIEDRVTLRDLPELCKRQRQGKGLDRVVELEDGRILYFDLDLHTNTVTVSQVLAEVRCFYIDHLHQIIDETVARMNAEGEY